MANTGPCHLRVAKTLLNSQNMKLLKFKTPMLLGITIVTVLNNNIRPFQTLHA